MATNAAEGSVKLDADQSLDALRGYVCEALEAAYPSLKSDDPNFISSPHVWVRELFPSYCIADVEGKLYRIDFALNGTKVTLGNKTEVTTAYKTAEASIAVAESSVSEIRSSQISKTGNKWDLQILHSGKTKTANKDLGAFDPSLSGRLAFRDYSAESIRDSIERNVWNGVPFVLRDKNDHLATANGTSRSLGVQMRMLAPNEELAGIAGVINGNYVAETAGGVAARAVLTLRNSAAGRAARAALQKAEADRTAEGSSAPLIDVSWTGDAESELTTSPFISEPIITVSRINEVTSVDPCLVGNAGGFIYQAAEAATRQTMTQEEKDLLKKKAAEAEADAGDDGGGVDIQTKVATAYLADNPGVMAYAGSVEEFLNSPNAAKLMSDWLDEELSEEDEALDDSEEESSLDADTNAAAEAAQKNVTKTKPKTLNKALKKAAHSEDMGPQKMVKMSTASAESVNPAILAEIAALRKQVGGLTAESVQDKLDAKLAVAKLPAPLEKMVRNQIKNTSAESAMGIMDSIILEAKNTAAEMSGEYAGGGYRIGDDERDKMKDGVMHMMFSTANARERALCKASEADGGLGKDYADRKYRQFSGPKQMYLDFVGGRDLGSGFGTGARGSVAESASAGELSLLVGDAMHRRMIMAYRTAEGWDDFQKISRFIPVNDFKAWHAQNLGYFLNPLTPITKGTDYPEIPITGNQDVLLTLVEQGGLFTINWVDMVNDNLEFFSKVPAEMGKGSKKQLYKAVFDRLTAGFTTAWQSTGSNEFSTTLGTAIAAAAISDTQISAMAVKLAAQTDLAGEIMGLSPKYLIYPQTQLKDAHNVLMPGAGLLTAPNAVGFNGLVTATASQSLGIQGIPVKHWTDTTYLGKGNYFLTADPEEVEMINILCYQGNQEPQIVQEATATGLNFTAKAIRFRLEHHWKVGLVENRGFVASTLS